MLRLAAEIQKSVLALLDSVCGSFVTERLLRPITIIADHRDQILAFHKFLEQAAIPLRP